jgi:hypothetical protein
VAKGHNFQFPEGLKKTGSNSMCDIAGGGAGEGEPERMTDRLKHDKIKNRKTPGTSNDDWFDHIEHT